LATSLFIGCGDDSSSTSSGTGGAASGGVCSAECATTGGADSYPGFWDCDAACASGDPAATTPLERATRTGELIGNVAHEVLREIIIEGRDQQEVWTEAYGAFVPTTPTPGGGILFDDAFELGPEHVL
jgi:hypothetical protein